MIELGVIIVLSLLLGWKEYSGRKERSKLINALMAKDAQDLVNLEMADKTQIKVQQPKPPDMVPMEQISDDEFEKYISQQAKKNEN